MLFSLTAYLLETHKSVDSDSPHHVAILDAPSRIWSVYSNSFDDRPSATPFTIASNPWSEGMVNDDRLSAFFLGVFFPKHHSEFFLNYTEKWQ
jgi:hypothetical protein